MQLAILIAVVASIASLESGGAPLADVAWRLFIVASAALLAPLAAFASSQRLAMSLDARADCDEAIERLEKKVIVLWLAAVVVILVVAQWPQIVRTNWRLANWPLVDELTILLPVIAPLILIWAILYGLEHKAQAVVRCRAYASPPTRLLRHLWTQARHQLGLVLLPPLVVVGVFDLLTALDLGPINLDVAWWFMLPLVGMMFVLLPVTVRRVWRTTPLAGGPLRERLQGVCRDRKCHVREILIWDTDGTMAN